MKKIAIFYIATGDYKDCFPLFLTSVKSFFPGVTKIIKVISDDLTEYNNYNDTVNKIKVEICPRINNYPWPIITLYKHWHILENLDEACEFSCYFNANSVIFPNDVKLWCNFNKLNCTYHSFGESYNPFDYININKNSSAYLENNTYKYIQAGFFFGKTSIVKKLCEDIIQMIKKDCAKHLFAQWHDESYMNKWCELNKELVHKEQIGTVYENVNAKTFIYFKPKNKKIMNNR